MLTIYAALYGKAHVLDDIVLQQQIGASTVAVKYPAAWHSNDLGGFGSSEWTIWHDSFDGSIDCAQLFDTPPAPAPVSDFGIASPGSVASLCMPLDDGRFVVVAGSYVYIQHPEDESYPSRLYLSNSASGGVHHVAAIAKVGSTAKIMFATRGNAAVPNARVLTIDLGAAPSGTVDMLTLPSYGVVEDIDWPYGLNWCSGLFPNVMGAFEYCVYRNAERSSDGILDLDIGVATSPPFADGGQMKMSGVLLLVDEDTGDFTSVTSATIGGTLSGNTLAAQSLDYAPLFTTDQMVDAAPISADDFSFDSRSLGLQLSFVTPPVPAFWTNLRHAQEII